MIKPWLFQEAKFVKSFYVKLKYRLNMWICEPKVLCAHLYGIMTSISNLYDETKPAGIWYKNCTRTCLQWESNSRPLVYETSALTTELWRHIMYKLTTYQKNIRFVILQDQYFTSFYTFAENVDFVLRIIHVLSKRKYSTRVSIFRTIIDKGYIQPVTLTFKLSINEILQAIVLKIHMLNKYIALKIVHRFNWTFKLNWYRWYIIHVYL